MGGVAELLERSQVRDAQWLVCVDADGSRSPPLVRAASGIEPEWLLDLFESRVRETNDVTWNATAERVEAKSRLLYESLLLGESALASAADDQIARVLADAALAKGARAFSPEGELDRWVARARFAAAHDAKLPSPTDDVVRAALIEACAGKKSFTELREISLLDVLKAHVGSMHLARIDQLAPERLTLASGRNAKIEYEDGAPRVESYLQDFFGMTRSPHVAAGRVPLVLHLLAPNKRAVQVTTDLAGFWERHYPSIKKELARKYPRHAWPDDPNVAIPMRRRS